jgi:uncharacterized protein YndB with AHSA1/START domain
MPVRWDRFSGSICGVGTASGMRLVVGRWEVSPFGSFADVMVERPDGTRVLLAPSAGVGDYVGAIYGFDEVVVVPVAADRTPTRLSVSAGPLELHAAIGRRTPLGWLLRAVPRRLARSPRWAAAIDPIASRLVAGVRTRGTTPGGEERYAATDWHAVTAVRATWDGEDLGPLAPVDPPVRFGFGSTPRQPSIVDVVTSVLRGRPSPMADDLTASATTHVDASAEEVFDFICRPANHPEISGDRSVKGDRHGPDVLTAEGQKFGMSMKMYGLPYRITNTVVEYEPGRKIAWCHPGKHRWRWEVVPVETGGCTVTETFDMSTSPLKPALKLLGYPKGHQENLEKSVANVAKHFSG